MRKLTNACLAMSLILGLAACSGSDGDADAKPDKGSGSGEVSEEQKLAEEFLPSPGIEPLSNHKAGKVAYVKKPRAPFDECTGDGPDSLKVEAQASREFDGQPRLLSHGFALDGDKGGVFGDLRKVWADGCRTVKLEVGEGEEATFLRTHEIAPPEAVEAESWFGVCYAGAVGKYQGDGMCLVVYRFGDDGIAEVRSFQEHKQNRAGAKLLVEVTGEVLAG